MKSFKLGEYLVQPKHNKLKKNEIEFKIEPKIMQVLCFLVQHKQEVVSRTEIAESLWPDTVIGPEVVTRAIFELRKVLNDDPKNPIYIETIARKGYCFIFEIEQSSDDAQVSIKRNHFHKNIYLISFLMMIFALILIGLFISKKDVKQINMQPTLLTNDSAYSDMPVISPSGDEMLFVKKGKYKDQMNQLVLMDLISYQEKTITQPDAEYKTPVWLAGSNHWFYIKCIKPNICSIIKHEIATNKTDTIVSLEKNIIALSIAHKASHIALSVREHDGVKLALVGKQGKQNLNYIEQQGENISLPTFSFDNQSLFYVSTVRGAAATLYQYNISSKQVSKVFSGFSRITGLSLKDQQTMWVTGNVKDKKGIWQLDLFSHSLKSVYETFPGYTPTLISSQLGSNKIIYKNLTRNIDIHKSEDMTFKLAGNTNSSMIDMNAVYSSQAKALYFVSNRSGLYDIWRAKNNEIQKVLNIKANMIERPILNLQENKLAVAIRKDLKSEVVILDLNKSLEINRVEIPKNVFLLSWSNDQKYIYFSKREKAQYNIYKLDVKTGVDKKVLVNAGAIVQENQNTGSLYYGDMEHKQLVEKTASGEVKVLFKLPDNERGLAPHRIKIVENGLFYTSKQKENTVLKYYSFEDKSLIEYMKLPLDAYVTDIVYDGEVSVIYDMFSNMNANLIQLTEIEENKL